jgi:hypothetical protein
MQVRRHRVAIGAAILGALALTIPSAALAIGTLDQEQAIANYPLVIDGSGAGAHANRVDQEFTAGRTGTLDAVALFIGRPDTLDAVFHVEIRDPGPDTSLAKGTVPAASVPATGAGGWVTITTWTGTPATVTAGHKYVIRVEWLDTGVGDYSWWRTEGDTYAAGNEIVDGVIVPGSDMAFRTYVMGAAAATPTPHPQVSEPPTSTVSPAAPGAPGSSTMALFALLGALSGGALMLTARRRRS